MIMFEFCILFFAPLRCPLCLLPPHDAHSRAGKNFLWRARFISFPISYFLCCSLGHSLIMSMELHRTVMEEKQIVDILYPGLAIHITQNCSKAAGSGPTLLPGMKPDREGLACTSGTPIPTLRGFSH